MIMENNYNMALENMRLSNDAKEFLLTSAKWARFLSITGFILYGLLLVVFVIMAAAMSGSSSYLAGNALYPHAPAAGSWSMVFMWSIMCVVYCIPLTYQLRFASGVKKAFAINDELSLTESFRQLKNLFVFNGIVTIIGMAFIAMALFFCVIAALVAAA